MNALFLYFAAFEVLYHLLYNSINKTSRICIESAIMQKF